MLSMEPNIVAKKEGGEAFKYNMETEDRRY